MNIYLPNNIFSKLIFENLTDKNLFKTHFLPSSVLTSELFKDKSAVALLPSFDLLKNEELFVASKFGISFEGYLSNSYFYFYNKADIKKLNVTGDVSSTEVLMSKIIFKEEYNIDVEIVLSQTNKDNNVNSLIIGDDNFNYYNVNIGLSLGEKISEIMDIQYPFVNYVLTSFEEDNLKYFNNNAEEIQNNIYEMVENQKFIQPLKNESITFIKENISSLIINFEEQDKEGLAELIKLPYYHGFFDDMVDIKFV